MTGRISNEVDFFTPLSMYVGLCNQIKYQIKIGNSVEKL